MSAVASLDRGREAFGRQAWAEAHAQLSATDAQLLEAEDLVRLAMSAYLMGRDSESVDILGRAYHELLDRGDVAQAVRCTFWVGFQLINKGDIAQAGGWFARGRRLLDENQLDCVEQGYLLVPLALQSLFGGDFPVAHEAFVRAAEIGERFGEADLITLARLGRGQALIGMGDTAAGVALLDEVMVGVTTGEVSAVVSGLVYCAVISVCQDVFDLRRAREWTEALTQWCASQPDLIPYRGQCLVHRARIMQFRGAWRDATRRAGDLLLADRDERGAADDDHRDDEGRDPGDAARVSADGQATRCHHLGAAERWARLPHASSHRSPSNDGSARGSSSGPGEALSAVQVLTVR